MDAEKIGKAIQFLRRRAGYTQRELAERLVVSDKAVSRWERGIGIPDVSLLRRLSIILDTDIDSLLEGSVAVSEDTWKGLLLFNAAPEINIYDKPLSDYVLSYFLLVKIRDIIVFCSEQHCDYLKAQYSDGTHLGINLTYCSLNEQECFSDCIRRNRELFAQSKIMTVFSSCVIYGVNLTRFLQRGMLNPAPITALAIVKSDVDNEIKVNGDRVIIKGGSQEAIHTKYRYCLLPFVFFRRGINAIVQNKFNSYRELCTSLVEQGILTAEFLDKGFVDFNVSDHNAALEASLFIAIVQKQTGEMVCCPEEIAYRRGFINNGEL